MPFESEQVQDIKIYNVQYFMQCLTSEMKQGLLSVNMQTLSAYIVVLSEQSREKSLTNGYFIIAKHVKGRICNVSHHTCNVRRDHIHGNDQSDRIPQLNILRAIDTISLQFHERMIGCIKNQVLGTCFIRIENVY